MYREFLKHKVAYAVLITGLVIATLSFMLVWPNHIFQRVIICCLAAFYFIWGVTTHVKSDHISRRIVFEYAGVAVLAAVVLLLVTL